MQKRVTIITIIVVSLLFLGVTIGLYLAATSSYTNKSANLAKQTESAQAELDTLKAKKDVNGFTATEAVKAFFGEVKSDSLEAAKLYLAPEVQAMDVKATLKLGSDLANVTTGENFEEMSEDAVTVSMTFVLPSEETTVRVFQLSKYDNAWKITGVTAE
jgi:Tfp pilus assembly protein PilW